MTTSPRTELHVVTGAGPVGSTVALQLADAGHTGPAAHPLRQRSRAPADRAPSRRRLPGRAAREHVAGAAARAPLHPRVGVPREDLARRAAGRRAGRARGGRPGGRGRRLPGEPLLLRHGRRPDDRGPPPRRHPRQARHPRRAAPRARRLPHPHRERGRLGLLRSGVRMSHAGERLVPKMLAGKTVNVVGSLDQPHSFTYVPDLARAMITAAAGRPTLWDSVLHAPTAPAVTQRRAGRRRSLPPPASAPRGCGRCPAWVLKAVGAVLRSTPASSRRRRTSSPRRSC